MPVPFNDQQKHDITVTIRGLADDAAGKPDNWPNWAAVVRSAKSPQDRLEGQSWEASGFFKPVLTGGWDSKVQLTALLRPIVVKAATYLTTTQAQNLNVTASQRASRESAGTALTYQQQQASPVAPVANV